MSTVHHDVPALAPPRLEEIGDGVFAYLQPDGSWWINNTGFLVGRRGVISVDSCATVRRTRAYLDAIATVTPKPVRTLVNTHHHGDHTFGNHLFRGATIVGHEATREGVLDWGEPRSAPYWTEVDWGEVVLEPPFLTFTDSVTLWSDELRAEVRHVGVPAHTTNDSVVWLPEQRLLFAGDLLFNGGTPFLVQGSVAGAVQVLEEVVKPLGATTVVPGHGDVAGPGLVDDVLGYLRFVQNAARDGAAAGLTPLETARELDLGGYGELLDPERIVGNLHRAYAELADGPLGRRIDVAAALADMVAYNGGRPLTCFA
ncbi:MBL fold metallo-hydrolase [Streptomyces sp. NPDC004838]